MRNGNVRGWLMACAIGALAVMPGTSLAQTQAAKPYSWQSVPFGGGGFVDGFLYHPKQKDVLYARTDIGGMYRYDFAAKAWIPLLDHLGRADGDLMGVLSMAVDPNDPNKLYAACGLYLGDWARKGAILRSSDQGRSWQLSNLPIHIGGNTDGRGAGERLVVDPRDGKTLYYGSDQDGLWASHDGGQSFTKMTSPGQSLSLVMVDPVSSQTLYAGVFDGKGGLFVSTDGGASFHTVDGTPAEVPQHAVFAPDGTLYVTFAESDKGHVNPSNAMRGGLWKRDPQSGKWNNISPVHPDENAHFGYSGVDVGPDGRVAVSTLDRWSPGDDIFVSKDAGKSWTALGGQSSHNAAPYPWLVDYLHGQEKMGHWIADLKINPFNGDELVYGTGFGVWMSRNLRAAGASGGVVFDFAVKNLEETETLQMTSPTGGATVLAAFGDVGGAAWDDVSKTPEAGLFRPTSENNYSVDYAGQAPAFVARVTRNDPTHGFYSEDNGADWTPFAATPYQPQAGAQGHGPGVVAVSAKAGSMLWVPEKAGAFYSADKGKTWQASAGWPADRDHTLTPIADKVAEGVYYVFDRANASILASVDGGASFKPVVLGLPGTDGGQLAVVPTRMRDLWLALPSGLLHSRDAATPMKAIAGVDTAWLVGFGAAAVKDGYPAVYLWGIVKGQEGLWRSDDEGKTWTRINDDAHRFGGLRAIAGDPIDYGTLYIAPHGRGIMVGKPGS